MKKYYLLPALLLLSTGAMTLSAAEQPNSTDHHDAMWDPIHYPPAIDTATDDQCLACHKEVLERKVLPVSPAGVTADSTLAWYQTLTTYEGPQETFHRRHMVTQLAKELMDMKCTTCHQGHNPREAAQNPPDELNGEFTLRKTVNTEKVCLMCHGRNPYEKMGLPKPWNESRDMFKNDCLLCHVAIRTTRHQVNFLKADAIEAAGKEDADSCFGCHGGRQWYRIAYPYPRHAWKGMAKEIPEWAKDRPTESEPRFRVPLQNAASE